MKKLRTQFILSFIGVILLAVVVPITLGIIINISVSFEQDRQLELLFSDLPSGSADLIFDLFAQFVARQMLLFLGLGVLLGTIVSIWLSGNLTAPLSKLATAAQAIGARDLSQRVDVEGSAEIMAVARSFNEMAAHLEMAETQRQKLLSDVAHELRTPVTVIQGNLRAILDDVYPLEKEEVARLYEQTRHLTRLIEDLREVAQAEAHQLSLNIVEVDVPKLLKDTAVNFKPLIKPKKIALRVELLGHLPPIQADGARLRQCLSNLVDNAIRHTPENGLVILQGEVLGEWLHLRVIDSGEGIAPEQLPHVFDRFYRHDKSRSRFSGGTGLGLAIVKAIAEMHDGEATAVSTGAGRGSTFTISLPLNQKERF